MAGCGYAMASIQRWLNANPSCPASCCSAYSVQFQRAEVQREASWNLAQGALQSREKADTAGF